MYMVCCRPTYGRYYPSNGEKLSQYSDIKIITYYAWFPASAVK